MERRSLRGAVLSPLAAGGDSFVPDGVVSFAQGVLVDTPGEPEIVGDLGRDGLLLVPGFVDVHIHLPQFRVRGQFQDALLPWLRGSIWPEEARFADRAYRASVAAEFRDALLAAGTTAAVVYGSPHEASAETVLRDLAPLTVRGGDVLMDRNSPEALARSTDEALRGAAALAGRWGDRYALTPRFVPTCTPELLRGLGGIAASTGAFVQSHVAENLDEVAWVAALHPEARSYLDVYERAGLLGPRCILGHGIHLDEDDLDRLVATGTWIAHCPTSNVALGSGRMPYGRMARRGVSIALATDVGAGPDVSMLDVMACFLAVQRDDPAVDPLLALRLATLSGARAMGEGERRGTLEPGRAADVVGLRIPGGLERGESGREVLARVLATFAGRWADAMAGVWIAGERVA
jgi:guanine deaminase